jgi:acetylornithine/succinyldiaminopimelate/putrescine aminotransferase
VLRFLPPYIVEKKHVDQVIRELDAALSSESTAPSARRDRKSTIRRQR